MPETLPKDEYENGLTMAHLIAGMVCGLPLSVMLDQISVAHAVGPFVDPTLYRDKMEALQQDEAVLRVLHTAQMELKKLYVAAEVTGG